MSFLGFYHDFPMFMDQIHVMTPVSPSKDSKVHGVHHGAFGPDVGDEHVDDVVAVLSHGIPHRRQDLVHLRRRARDGCKVGPPGFNVKKKFVG